MAQRSITLVTNTLKDSLVKINSTNTFVFRSFFKPAASANTAEVSSAKRSRQESPQSNGKIGEPEKKIQRKSEEADKRDAKQNVQTNDKNKDTKKASPKASKKSPKNKNTSSPFKKQINDIKKEITNEKETLDNKLNITFSPFKKHIIDVEKDIPNEKENEKSDSKPAEVKSESKSSKEDDASKQNSGKDYSANVKKLSVEANQCGAEYNPASARYHPIKDAYWKAKQSTPYLALARTFEMIEDTKGRYKMVEILANFLSSVLLLNPDDLLSCIYLSINQLAPAYEGVELGVAETTLMKVIAVSTGRELKFIKTQTQEIGDLGIVAERSRVSQRMMFTPKPLTVQTVYQKLRTIAKSSGKAKSPIIHDLFVASRYSEARYIIRSLIGKMRIGIAEKSLFQALATALVCSRPYDDSYKKEKQSEADIKKDIEDITFLLKTAYCQCPNFDKIVSTLLTHGIDDLLKYCTMEPGVPLKPMLAHPTRGVSEVMDRLKGNITCEWKYDGERAQIHGDNNGTVNIYSRNQENNTTKYPDIINRIDHFKKDTVQSFIVDSEVVAWDIEQKQILPFQVLSTRKRKNVDVEEIKVQVCVYAFDLLYLNGVALTSKNFEDRRQLLRDNFNEVEGEFQFATSCDTNDPDDIQGFLENSIKGNCEGLMIKSLDNDATYEIAKRSHKWLKLKKDYLTGVGDSLDLVVIGGYMGKGKRTGVFGGFLLACYDDENEEYQSICKIGTGLNDEDLSTHAKFFKEHTIPAPKSYYRFDASLAPDTWFEAVQVWEIKCADLSLSPVHKAAIGIIDPEKGISLRFPRFIRIRDDKSTEDATGAQQVAYMYRNQDQVKNQKTNAAEFDDDFY
ncbi:PREDICTED: DNA ligase 1 isoform X1 [Bactrocera latifrons]|uniref:DNA ligase n=1 Tax=Bactrocera latifrons TaxID=174628 RepID=A0A0K8V3S1_BACLA|nr:PREDICTED: DNA ligase 1 isoform X1 [Bactrocera latifrons]